MALNANTNANRYHKGDVAVLRATFTNTRTSAVVDPVTVQLKVLRPDGQTDTYTYSNGAGIITRDAAGVYVAEYSISHVGDYHYAWICTNPNGVEKNFFTSHPTPFDS